MTAVFQLLFVTTILLIVSHVNAQQSREEASYSARVFTHQIYASAVFQKREGLNRQISSAFTMKTCQKNVIDKTTFIDTMLDSAKKSDKFRVNFIDSNLTHTGGIDVLVNFENANESILGTLSFYLDKNECGQTVAIDGACV